MRVRHLAAVLLLLQPAVYAGEVHGGTTLKEISRDAEERLKQWDEEDVKQEAYESRYWWVGWIELAVSVACGKAFLAPQTFLFSGKNGLTVRGNTPSVDPGSPPPVMPAPSKQPS